MEGEKERETERCFVLFLFCLQFLVQLHFDQRMGTAEGYKQFYCQLLFYRGALTVVSELSEGQKEGRKESLACRSCLEG